MTRAAPINPARLLVYRVPSASTLESATGRQFVANLLIEC
jgi:hypothetical protein